MRSAKCAVAKVVHSFGREDELDRAALVTSAARSDKQFFRVW